MTMDEQEKLARQRLMQLNVVRMFGIVSVIFAALNISGKILPDREHGPRLAANPGREQLPSDPLAC